MVRAALLFMCLLLMALPAAAGELVIMRFGAGF